MHKMGTDRCENNAGALCRPGYLEKLPSILQHHAYVITGLQPQRAKKLGALVGTLIQLAIGNNLSGFTHDDCGFMGVSLCDDTGVRHAIFLAVNSTQNPTIES